MRRLAPRESGAAGVRAWLLDRGVARDGGANFWSNVKESETCITGMLLTIAAAFAPDDRRCERIVE